MGESIITRKKGGVSIPQTELPVITFISGNDTSLTFSIRNEDDEQAIVYYELGDDTPDSASITLNGNTTSSNIVFSGLTPGTTYTLYVWANAFNKSTSQVASNTQSTTQTTVAPTITYVSKTWDTITFTVKNNDSETATVYYEQGDDTPDANSVVLNAGATSSNLTISGLTKQTSYTIYAQAQATGKNLSNAVSFTETTPDFPTLANPTITFVSASSDRIRITLKNNATISANIYYEHSDTTPDANFITLGAGVTSGTIEVTGLNASTSYTIYAQAQQTNAYPSGVVSITQSTTAPQGQITFTTSSNWTVPAGVTSISAFLVGAGSGGEYNFLSEENLRRKISGAGGCSVYFNLSVTPGHVYTITIGLDGGTTDFRRQGSGSITAQALGGAGNGSKRETFGTITSLATNIGTGIGGRGNNSGYQGAIPQGWGAGGSAGYGGDGGNSGEPGNGTSGQNGGGGGGFTQTSTSAGGSGGGVGLLGQGTNGAGGTSASINGAPGSGGSSRTYGGGRAAGTTANSSLAGGAGAMRIIWGTNRSYPSTNTGDV